jgi:hypothetical protein
MKGINMKQIFLALLLILPSLAFAQTPVSKETANGYFTNCVKQPPSQQFSAESQNMFCACTAARLTQYFTMEDWTAMVDNKSPNQRPAFNKMMVNIYAPCMETPSYEHYYNTCLANPETKKYGDSHKICTCLARAMASHMKVNGPNVLEQAIRRDPNIADPMTAITDDPSFTTFAQQNLVSCVTKQ